MGMTAYDVNNISKLLSGEGDWFTARLLRLLPNADEGNLRKLGSVYPDVVCWFLNHKHGGVPPRFSDVSAIVVYMNDNRYHHPMWIDGAGNTYRYLQLIRGGHHG